MIELCKANENAYSKILSELLLYKDGNKQPFLELFIKLLNNELDKNSNSNPEFKIDYSSNNRILYQKDYIDVYIRDVKIETQKICPSGRIDMFIEARLDDKKSVYFICEHKVWSELSEWQIGKYVECYKKSSYKR